MLKSFLSQQTAILLCLFWPLSINYFAFVFFFSFILRYSVVFFIFVRVFDFFFLALFDNVCDLIFMSVHVCMSL